MGELVQSPNTYAGELYTEMILPLLIPPLGLVDKGLVTPMPGIKKRTVLRLFDTVVEFQDPSCDFNDQDTDPTIAERYIDPVTYEVMIEMCWKDVKAGWDAMKLKKGALNNYIPPATIEDAFLELVGNKIKMGNEQMYIRGKGGVTAVTATFTADYPGLLERLRADSAVNKVLTSGVGGTTSIALTGVTSASPGIATVASTANLRTGNKITLVGLNGNQQVGGTSINGQEFVITVVSATTFSLNKAVTGATPATSGTVMYLNQSNVLDFLSYIYSNIPEQVYDDPSLKIWVPRGVWQAYSLIQATNAPVGSYFVGEKEMDFLGNKLTVVPNLPANTAIIAPASHIFLGFDDSGDENNIKTVYMGDTTLDQKFRYKAAMSHDINHVNGQDIVLISPDITPES